MQFRSLLRVMRASTELQAGILNRTWECQIMTETLGSTSSSFAKDFACTKSLSKAVTERVFPVFGESKLIFAVR